jgi:hypothetical protein
MTHHPPGRVASINNKAEFVKAIGTDGNMVSFAPTMRDQVLDLEPRVRVTANGVSIMGNEPVGIKGTLLFENSQGLRFVNLRFVEARKAGDNADCLSLLNCKNVRIRNCDFTAGTDENLQLFADTQNVRISETVIYSPLFGGTHSKGPHPYACQVTGSSGGKFKGAPDRIRFENCLFALFHQRAPQIMGNADGSVAGRVNMRKCIVYGWLNYGTKVGRNAQAFIDRCLYVQLPGSSPDAILEVEGGTAHVRDSYVVRPDGTVEALGEVTDPRLQQKVLGLVRDIDKWGAQPTSRSTEQLFELVRAGQGDPMNPDLDPPLPRWP